jgi:hypothetical protein
MRPAIYRVRVGRLIEDWVEVKAFTARDAEDQAAKVPGVKMVFGRSAILATDNPRDIENENVRED